MTGAVADLLRHPACSPISRPALAWRLLLVSGVMQRSGEVRHLRVERLEDHSPLLGRLTTRSRDFH